MRPLLVWARSFRSWEELDFRVPEGITAILGENGAGKSSLLHALDQALFGGRGELGRMLQRGGGSELCEVGCELEHRGELYRITRQAGAKPMLAFERNNLRDAEDERGERLDSWVPLTRETMAATQALIEETLGLSRDTLRASALLMQGDGAAFTEAPPAKRKEILAAALGLGFYERLREQAAGDRRAAEEGAAGLGVRLTDAHLRLAEKPRYEEERAEATIEVAGLRSQIIVREEAEQLRRGELEEARRKQEAREQAERQSRQAAQSLAEARQSLEGAQAALAGLRLEAESRAELERLAGLAPALEACQEAQRASESARAREAGAAKALEEALAREAEATRRANNAGESAAAAELALLAAQGQEALLCPTCGQETLADARERALASLRSAFWAAQESAADFVEAAGREATTAEGLRRDLADAISDAEEAAQELLAAASRLGGADPSLVRQAAQSLATLDARLERLPELEEREKELAGRLEELSRAARLAELPAPADVGGAESALLAASAALRHERGRLEEALRREASLAERLSALAQLEEQAAGWEEEQVRALREAAVSGLLEQAFGRSGIPALILETRALPQIEGEANRIIGELGRSLRFELRTQRQLAGGGVADALDIAVLTPSGEALYEDFSGGEQTRLNLALRIALARLLANSRAAEVGLLAIDEPSFLDEAGFARLAAVLRSLEREFPSILVVSHVPALRDAFDSAVLVQGGADTGEPSRLEAL